jgi:hypothetical protein
MVFNAPFNNISVSFIGGENWSTRRKPLTCRKSLTRQFLSPFHKDYLTTNFNLTTKITLTIKNSPLGVLDTTLCDKVCQ